MKVRRCDIEKECPQEFEEQLSDFIDEIESDVNSIRDLLAEPIFISGIEEAYYIAKQLSDQLY